MKLKNKITTDHDHDKCITTQEFHKLTSEGFIARLKQANFASKSDIANLVKKTNLNKNELNELSKKVKAISTKGLTKDLINEFSILNAGRIIPAEKYIKYFSGINWIESSKSNRISEKNIENVTRSEAILHQLL